MHSAAMRTSANIRAFLSMERFFIRSKVLNSESLGVLRLADQARNREQDYPSEESQQPKDCDRERDQAVGQGQSGYLLRSGKEGDGPIEVVQPHDHQGGSRNSIKHERVPDRSNLDDAEED